LPDIEETIPLSRRSRKIALFLAIFPWTGFLGIDRFYLGYIGIGLLKFITAGGFLVLYVVDIVKIAKGTMRDKDGNRLR
jgi:TM2 domain-containing membrane protein YozV